MLTTFLQAIVNDGFTDISTQLSLLFAIYHYILFDLAREIVPTT